MSTMKHAPHPVTHSWHVKGLQDANACGMLAAHLKGTPGILAAACDTDHNKITITYDILQVTAEEIEMVMMTNHMSLGSGLLLELERGWIHFTEKNERDSLTFVPRSFNSVPNNPRMRT